MNLAHRLAMLTSQRLKVRARSEKPGLLGRSWWSEEPKIDRAEARMCGAAAARAACEGHTGVTVTLARHPGADYHVSTGLAPFEKVALHERLFPVEWRNAAGSDVTQGFRDYAAPLIGPINHYQGILAN